MTVEIHQYFVEKYQEVLNQMYRSFYDAQGKLAAKRFVHAEIAYFKSVMPILVKLELIEQEDWEEVKTHLTDCAALAVQQMGRGKVGVVT